MDIFGNLKLVNCDTDSLMVCKPDGSIWSKDDQKLFLNALNDQFPELIKFEHDGYFERVLVVKSKNYALVPEGSTKIKFKGSSIKDQKKEPALREMMDAIINALLYDKQDTLVSIYHKYIKEALDVKDINRWTQKKTITESVLKCEDWTEEDIKAKRLRKNETDVWDAIKDLPDIQEGNKVWIYPAILGYNKEIKEYKNGKIKETITPIERVKAVDNFNNDYNKEKLLQRVHDTISIFENVLNIDDFIDYTLKKNKEKLDSL